MVTDSTRTPATSVSSAAWLAENVFAPNAELFAYLIVGLQVLFGVDLDVRRGERVALLGTNGAGKSTVLRVISGLLPSTGGSVSFAGTDITGLDPVQRVRLGLVTVPGGRGVFGSLTVAENLRVAECSQHDDVAYVEQVRQEIFSVFPQLERLHGEKATNMSGGE